MPVRRRDFAGLDQLNGTNECAGRSATEARIVQNKNPALRLFRRNQVRRLVYQWSNLVPVVPVNRLARRRWLRWNGLGGNCPEWSNVLARQAPIVIISCAAEGWCVHGLLLGMDIKTLSCKRLK